MLKDSFCSSPWFHLRLNYSGAYDVCRWTKPSPTSNISEHSVMEFYNSERMSELRSKLLNGESPQSCGACYYQDKFNKLSGRVRQLNKSAISLNDFELSLRSSPHYKHFEYSNNNQGLADYYPVDLQIDLGNVCNSACIMCEPAASSKLTVDYQKLHKINSTLFKNPAPYTSWTQNEALVTKFVDEITQIPNIKYIHFLGGETLFDETFYTICQALIDSGKSKNIVVGTTTNGTIYDDRVEKLIKQFKGFHLGISIESVSELNDYVRWPGKISTIKNNIEKFLNLRSQFLDLIISMRITPNVFTIYEFDQLAEYLIEHQVIAESCNILYDPDCLRMELLPDDIRQEIVVKLEKLIHKFNLDRSEIVNVRRPDLTESVIGNVILEYHEFIKNYQQPDNVEELRYKLVDFLKSFESIRNNSILDYAPRYEDFLRHYGY